MGIRIDIRMNKNSWQQALLKARDQMGNFAPAFNGIEEDMRLFMQKIFWSEGTAFGGTKWEELKRPAEKLGKVAEGKKRRPKGTVSGSGKKFYPGKTILRRTDDLYRSLTVEGAEGAVVKTGKTQMVIATTVYYAGYHQTGTKSGGKTRMVARPIMQPGAEKLVAKRFKEYVQIIVDKFNSSKTTGRLQVPGTNVTTTALHPKKESEE